MARGNGEGTIYKRKTDGLWCGQIDFGRDLNTGKRVRKSIYGKTKREVRTKMLDMMQKYNNRQINLENINLLDWMYKWLDTYKKPKLRPRTYNSYKSLINNHIAEIGQYKLKKLKPIIIQQFVNSKQSDLSERTIRYIVTVLKAGLEQAVNNNLIFKNPCKNIEIPKTETKKREIKPFTIEEQAMFLKAANKSIYCSLYVVALETGMRRGELLGLKWDDINFDEKVIHVRRGIVETKINGEYQIVEQEPKTEAGKRDIPMTSKTYKALKNQRKKQYKTQLRLNTSFKIPELVFSTYKGTYISPKNLSRNFYLYLKKAGIDKRGFHVLRHTFATRLIEKNANVKMVQALLGHADISTTLNTYSHALPDAKADTISLLEQEI